jgi:hypothetical protein
MAACGVTRAGSRIQSTYEAALTHAVRSRKIRKRKDFLWSASKAGVKVRNRRNLDNTARNIEMIAPEEIAAAIGAVVEQSYSIKEDELLAVVAGSFGIQRVTANIKSALKKQFLRLVRSGDFERDGEFVSLRAGRV